MCSFRSGALFGFVMLSACIGTLTLRTGLFEQIISISGTLVPLTHLFVSVMFPSNPALDAELFRVVFGTWLTFCYVGLEITMTVTFFGRLCPNMISLILSPLLLAVYTVYMLISGAGCAGQPSRYSLKYEIDVYLILSATTCACLKGGAVLALTLIFFIISIFAKSVATFFQNKILLLFLDIVWISCLSIGSLFVSVFTIMDGLSGGLILATQVLAIISLAIAVYKDNVTLVIQDDPNVFVPSAPTLPEIQNEIGRSHV